MLYRYKKQLNTVMKYQDLVLEYNQEKLIVTFGKKMKNRIRKDHSLTLDINKPIESFFTQLDKDIKEYKQFLDPYVKWIVQRYAKGDINLYEDITTKAIPYLLKYDALKRKKKLKPEHKDINQFKSINDLMDIVDTYGNVESKKSANKNMENMFYETDQADLIYNDEDLKVVSPKTYKASCYFGRNTRWCTTGEHGGESTFNSYSTNSPLYIVLIKKHNKRFQFHFSSNQFMNEQDRPIDPHKLANKYPILWDIFTPIANKHNSIMLNKNPSEKTKLSVVSKNGDSIRFINDPSEAVQLAAANRTPYSIAHIKNPSEEVQLVAVNKAGMALQFIDNPSEQVKLAAVTQNGEAIAYVHNPPERLQLAAVKATLSALQYIDNPTERVQLTAVSINPYAIKFIENPPDWIQSEAIRRNPNSIHFITNPDPKVEQYAKEKLDD